MKQAKAVNEASCLLCRVIGHKFTTRRKYSVGDTSMSNVVHWNHCLRCGRPAPGGLKGKRVWYSADREEA